MVSSLSYIVPESVEYYESVDFPNKMHTFAEEVILVSGASAQRRWEFSAGRICAHNALARLGVEMRMIGIHDDCSPIWPEGISGSITHTKDYAAAIVAPKVKYRSLGIDAEPYGSVSADLDETLFSQHELGYILGSLPWRRDLLRGVLFSAKEACFKVISPLGCGGISFPNLEIAVKGDRFRMIALREGNISHPPQTNVIGRWTLFENKVIAVAWIPNCTGTPSHRQTCS